MTESLADIGNDPSAIPAVVPVAFPPAFMNASMAVSKWFPAHNKTCAPNRTNLLAMLFASTGAGGGWAFNSAMSRLISSSSVGSGGGLL